jgi:hypothetical protein
MQSVDKTAEIEAEASTELARYCEQHPLSPTAQRRPRLLLRGRSWVALLGYTLQDGVAGIGSTVAAALRAFDIQYANSLKPPRG